MGEKFIVVLVSTASEEEAASIAGALVGEGLAACVNIVPSVKSIYRWKGEVEEASEVLCVIKTEKRHFDKLKERVLELHSYDTPEVIALPITGASSEYLKWIEDSLK